MMDSLLVLGNPEHIINYKLMQLAISRQDPETQKAVLEIVQKIDDITKGYKSYDVAGAIILISARMKSDKAKEVWNSMARTTDGALDSTFAEIEQGIEEEFDKIIPKDGVMDLKTVKEAITKIREQRAGRGKR